MRECVRKKSGFQAERARRRTQQSVKAQNYRENALQQSKSGAFIVLDDQILILLLPFFYLLRGVHQVQLKPLHRVGQ